MRILTLILTVLMSLMLFSCGGGGGGGGTASGDAVRVKINIDKRAFDSEAKSISYSGRVIDRIRLRVSTAGIADIDMFIQDEVNSGSPVVLTLAAYKNYVFSIYAYDTDGNELCSGSASAYISKDTTTDITLICSNGGTPVFLTGIAASGLPIEGTVYLKDSNGTVKSTEIGANGSFSIDVSDMTPPYVMRAEGKIGDKSVTLYSTSAGSGNTANINPYTNLALSIAVGGLDLESVFTNPQNSQSLLSPANIENAVSVVKNIFTSMFSAMGISDFDPINGAYSADGSGMDGVLDNLSINVSGGTINIVNNNTGESVVSVTVANAGSASIPAAVASEVASYVSTGASTLSEVKSFLSDYLFTRSRSYANYYSTSLTWLNGLNRSSIVAGTFPAASTLTELHDVAIVQRSGANNVTVYYTVIMSDGSVNAYTSWLVKEGNSWYFTGNGLMFARTITPVSVLNRSSLSAYTTGSGLDFIFADPSSQGINLISVTGPGLPSDGLRYYNSDGQFVLYNSSAAPTDSIYYMTDTQINQANTSFMENGFIKYTLSAYSSYSGSTYLPSGNLIQTADFNLRKTIETNTAIAADTGRFITQTNLATFDLGSILTSTSVSVQTNAAGIEDFSNGYGSLTCSSNYGSATFSHNILPSSPNIVLDLTGQPLDLVQSCDAYLVYNDSLFRKFMTYAYFERSSDTGGGGTGPTEAEIESALTAASVQLATALSTVTSVNITSNITLPTDLGSGVTVSWQSSNTSVISNTGVVTRPSYTTGNVTVNLTATIIYSGSSTSVTFPVTVTAAAITDTETAAIIDAVTPSVVFDLIKGLNTSSTAVTSNLVLPTSLVNGVTITWTSSNAGVISNAGVVARPSYSIGNTTVILTAALTKNSLTKYKTITVTVLALAETSADSDAALLSVNDLLGLNSSAAEIVFDLNFAPLLRYENIIKCYSGNHTYIDDNGEIIARPTLSEGPKTIAITCYVDPNGANIPRTDLAVVLKPVYQPNIDAGDEHVLMIAPDGTLWGWGNNWDYALGMTDEPYKMSPDQLSSDTNWAAVSGGYPSMAIKTDGTLWGWGSNDYGGLGSDTGFYDTPTDLQLDLDGNSQIDNDWVYVAVGYYSSFAIKADGTLWAVGDNSYGQLGLGEDADGSYYEFQRVNDDTDWAYVYAGDGHTVAIKKDGSLWVWGDNESGQLCVNADTSTIYTPTEIATGMTFKSASAGGYHTLMIDSDGTLYGCGDNYYGQLGQGMDSGNSYDTMTEIGAPTTAWSSVSAGGNHSLAVTAEGELYAWGTNEYGQTGVSDEDSEIYEPARVGNYSDWIIPAAGWDFSIAVRGDGSVYGWGYNGDGAAGIGEVDTDSVYYPTKLLFYPYISPAEAAYQIALGPEHSIVNPNGHELFMTGDDSQYELFVDPVGLQDTTIYLPDGYSYIDYVGDMPVESPFLKVVAGSNFSAYLAVGGDVVYSGYYGGDGDPVMSETVVGTGMAHLVAGYEHMIALDDNGWLYSFGDDTYGQSALGYSWWDEFILRDNDYSYTDVFAGPYTSFAIRDDGKLLAWGKNDSDQLGFFTDGENVTFPDLVNDDTDWEFVSSGLKHTLALKTDGTLWAWGNNDEGELGDGDSAQVSTPEEISTDSWLSVAAGGKHSAGVKTDGTLWVWGDNTSYQLGGATQSASSNVPVQLGSANNWIYVTASENNTIAMNINGQIYVWGENNFGLLMTGNDTPVTVPTLIEAYSFSSGIDYINALLGGNLQCDGDICQGP